MLFFFQQRYIFSIEIHVHKWVLVECNRIIYPKGYFGWRIANNWSEKEFFLYICIIKKSLAI